MEKAVSKSKSIGRSVVLTGIGLAIVHSVAVFNDWYRLIPWIDIPLHFWGGVVGTLLFSWLVYRFPGYINVEKNFLVTLAIALSWAALGGVVWEFGEFIYDLTAHSYGLSARSVQSTLDDTLSDLVFDLIGGFAVAVAMLLSYHKRGRLHDK
jgi:hypothetical protein